MNFTNIKGILFDKDGTLLNYDETWGPINWKAALQATKGSAAKAIALLEATGFDRENNTVRAGSTLGAGNSKEIAEQWAKAGASFSKAELTVLLDGIFTAAMEEAVPIAGLQPTIGALHVCGFRLGVASSDSSRAVNSFVAHVRLSRHFSFTCGYDSGFGHKPDPGMFLAFCENQGLDPSQVAMVGDNPQDLEMAQAANAGLKIAVLSGNGAKNELAPFADVILHDMSEIPALFGLDVLAKPMINL